MRRCPLRRLLPGRSQQPLPLVRVRALLLLLVLLLLRPRAVEEKLLLVPPVTERVEAPPPVSQVPESVAVVAGVTVTSRPPATETSLRCSW